MCWEFDHGCIANSWDKHKSSFGPKVENIMVLKHNLFEQYDWFPYRSEQIMYYVLLPQKVTWIRIWIIRKKEKIIDLFFLFPVIVHLLLSRLNYNKHIDASCSHTVLASLHTMLFASAIHILSHSFYSL